MKLLRYGAKGQEKPGLLDGDGRIRSLAGVVSDISGSVLGREALDRIRALDPATLPLVEGEPRLGPCVGAIGKFICIGLNYADHAAESGLKVPPEPVIFMKATSAVCGPNDPVEIPRGSREDRLGGRARRGDRHRRALHRGERCFRAHRRLLRGQRCVGARVPGRAQRAVDQGEEPRHVRPNRALAGDRRRGCRPSGSADVAGGGRSPLPGRLDAHHGLQSAVPRELSVPVHEPASRAMSSRPARPQVLAWARSPRAT